MENFKKLLESEKKILPNVKKKLLNFLDWCRIANPQQMEQFNKIINFNAADKIQNTNLIINLLDLYKKFKIDFAIFNLEQQNIDINLANIEKFQNN